MTSLISAADTREREVSMRVGGHAVFLESVMVHGERAIGEFIMDVRDDLRCVDTSVESVCKSRLDCGMWYVFRDCERKDRASRRWEARTWIAR